MNQYGKGKLFVLTVPDNFTDLYEIPEPTLNAIRSYLMGDFPVRIEAPAKVSLFAYDNGTFIVESFRDQPVDVKILLPAGSAMNNLLTGNRLTELLSAKGPQETANAPRLSAYGVKVQPHSYQVFTTKK